MSRMALKNGDGGAGLRRFRAMASWVAACQLAVSSTVMNAAENAGTTAPAPAADEKVSHWAFQPVSRPALPGNGNAVDAFVGARLRTDGLTMSPEADRVTLIRRVYLVMLGLPPSPEEVAAFVGDRGEQAFERLVDRVLEDSRYGERWGRHWLDVIRFAETNGFETNRERPNAWRFRVTSLRHSTRTSPTTGSSASSWLGTPWASMWGLGFWWAGRSISSRARIRS